MKPATSTKSCLKEARPLRWRPRVIIVMLFALLQAPSFGQSPISFPLRSEPLFEYFFTSLNGYTFYVEPEFFFTEMPKVLECAAVDSVRKQEMRAELQRLGVRRGICGDKSHMHMNGDWKPVFERFVANNLHNGRMFHIAHERTGRVVHEMWYTRKMKTAHGPGIYRYYTDPDHKELVFSLRVRRGGRPLTDF